MTYVMIERFIYYGDIFKINEPKLLIESKFNMEERNVYNVWKRKCENESDIDSLCV